MPLNIELYHLCKLFNSLSDVEQIISSSWKCSTSFPVLIDRRPHLLGLTFSLAHFRLSFHLANSHRVHGSFSYILLYGWLVMFTIIHYLLMKYFVMLLKDFSILIDYISNAQHSNEWTKILIWKITQVDKDKMHFNHLPSLVFNPQGHHQASRYWILCDCLSDLSISLLKLTPSGLRMWR